MGKKTISAEMNSKIERKKPHKDLEVWEKSVIINCYELGLKPKVISTLVTATPRMINPNPKPIIRTRKFDGHARLIVKNLALEAVQTEQSRSYRKLAQLTREELKKFTDQKGPSFMTCYRILHEDDMIKSVHPLSRMPLTPQNKAKRLEYALSWFKNGQFVDRNILWTDEVMVKSHPNLKHMWVFVRGDELYQNYPVRERYQGGLNSVMFWGCFSKNAPGPLVSLVGHQNAQQYLQTIDENLAPEYMAAKQDGKEWTVMQDNCSIHRAKVVQADLRRRNIPLLKWPPYSPDLNPIENIWAWMKHRLYADFPPCKDANEVEEVIMRIWADLTPELCQRFAGNYEKRLLAVIEAKGGRTKY